jgi:hypothetical protein
MAWNNLNGMMPNPYGVYGAPMPNYNPNVNASIDNMYAAYKQSQAQMMGNNQPSMNVNPSMGQRGVWIQVHDYKEVENYPVPADGTPTLFFDFEHGMFYSKKFVNGQCCVQDFYFGSTAGNVKQQKEEPTVEMPSMDANANNEIINSVLERMDEFGTQLKALDATVKKLSKAKAGE